MPLISVIVPVFDVEDHVAACIASLRAQTLGDFEVIVVDDGSTDASAARAQAAINGDPRFALISQDNRGLSGARNTGLAQARGQFIAFVDSDDRVAPDYLMQLWTALEQSGADWAACAVQSCFADGTSHVHSAIHDAPDLAMHPGPRRYGLDNWCQVIRHFPSAWNKLYRATLIADLRFDEGTWFEDHGFFYRAAARTDHLLHVPQPLYLQTRGRDGQITTSDDDRVFEQFDVLREMRAIMATSARPGADAAFGRIATRLVFERSTALRDPVRRARFAHETAAFLQQQGLIFDPDWDDGIARAWALEMAGTLPLSLILPWDGASPEALCATLNSLAGQGGPGCEVLVVCAKGAALNAARDLIRNTPEARVITASGRGGAAALRSGVAAAQGLYVVCLQPGDILRPAALRDWVETMLRTGAQVGQSQFWQGTEPDALPHNGFDDMRALPGGTPATGAIHITPHMALAMAPDLSARIFERAFLRDTAPPFTNGPLPHWALCLAAPLMAETCAYIGWSGVALDLSADGARARAMTRRARAMARGHDATVRALPEAVRARLPGGWQRRLFARALRLQVSLALPKARPQRALRLAGLMAATLRRGLSGPRRDPAGFDPAFGPGLAQVMNPMGLLGGTPLLPHAPSFAAQNAKTHHTPDGDHRMHAFPLRGRGLLRFRANFHTEPYANISFIAADGLHVPFHVSLRHDEKLVVCNDSRRDGAWRAERLVERALPRDGVDVAVELTAHHATVWIDQEQVIRLGRRSLINRAGLKGLSRIRQVDAQGGIRLLDIVPSRPGAALALDPRLLLRAGRASGEVHLTVAHSGETLALLPAPDLDGSGVLAELPGRYWLGLEAGAPLVLLEAPGRPALTLERATMAAHIETLMAHPPGPADAALVLHMLDHLRHGQLHTHLSSTTIAELRTLADRYGLDDYGDAQNASPQPPVPAAPAPAPDPVAAQVDAALARFTQSQMLDPAPDPLQVVRELALSGPARQGLFLALTDVFCREGGDFEGLNALAREVITGKDALDRAELSRDVWSQSASLPYLVMARRYEEAAERLYGLTGDGWVLTPPVAWVARRAVSDPDMPDAARQRLLYGFIDFVTRHTAGYWDRGACSELVIAAVTVLLDNRRDDYFGTDVVDFCLRAYGLSRRFWETLADRCPDGHALPPRITTALTLFAQITPDAPPEQIDKGLQFFEAARCVDAARLRVELLGPSGLPLPHGAPPTAAALSAATQMPDLAALRHMAYPNTAPVDADMSDLAATAIPRLYSPVPSALYGALQIQVSQIIAQLLTWSAPPDPDWLRGVLQDLEPLTQRNSGFLGIGLALIMTRHLDTLGDNAGAQACTDWVLARHSAYRRKDRAALALAPALRGPLARLRDTDTSHIRTLIETLGTDLPLPAPHGRTTLPEGSPLYDTLVVVFSCKAYLDTRIPALRTGWLSLLGALDIPYIFVVGNGDGRREGDIVHLDAPDDYEGLPHKTLAAIRWVHDNTNFAHMLKIDDDCFLNAPLFFQSLTYRKFDYYGRKLTREVGQMDRAWHQAKSTSERGQFELDRSPEPSVYADGGSGYALSRRAMAAALDMAQSPAGQRLVQLSFMEDKMLGDLLALYGIQVVEEDYRVSIRRRTFGAAVPVAAWHNSFFPSKTATLQLIHLDTHTDQTTALEQLDRQVLWPPKIWPSYQAPKLGYQSNALELLSSAQSVEQACRAEVAVVAVMRNEMFMIGHFLAHYRALGVTSFLIADNASDDGTREYLLEQPDVALFSVDTDYKLSHYGVSWQQALMSAFRLGKWSLVADADELLVWQENQTQTLPDLLGGPDFVQAEAVRIFMLDMYPKGPLEDATFDSGDPFAEAGYCDAHPFLTNTPARGPYSDQPIWTSALRHRLIPGSRGTLFVAQKLALLRYHPYMRLSDGLHFVGDVRVAQRELLFAHFKYNAAFREKARTEVTRRQHFNDAEEYRKYLAMVSEGRSVIHDPDLSVRWTESPFVRDRLKRP